MNNEKYNDFDELYDVFMEAGSDEWLVQNVELKKNLIVKQ